MFDFVLFVSGSSTACVVVLNRENSRLYTANIGDSGYMVVRRGRIIHRSEEQQHYFNTPFQLSLPPPGYQADVLSDRPDSASTDNFPVEDGDVILVATDGVFDNLPQNLLISELVKVKNSLSGQKVADFIYFAITIVCLLTTTVSLFTNNAVFCFFQVQGERSASRLQTVANSIAWMARNLSFDERFFSPFAESALANGISTIGNRKYTVLLVFL